MPYSSRNSPWGYYKPLEFTVAQLVVKAVKLLVEKPSVKLGREKTDQSLDVFPPYEYPNGTGQYCEDLPAVFELVCGVVLPPSYNNTKSWDL